jgi:aspartate aminotransferase
MTSWSREHEAALARPLEEFSALHASTLRRRRDVLDLSYPNATHHRDHRAFGLLRGLAGHVTQDELQYTPLGGGPMVRRLLAEDMKRSHGLAVDHRNLVLTPGATAALCVALTAAFRPGDEVLVPTPCWMDYPLLLHRFGITAVLVPCGPDKRLDPEAIARAVTPRTAGLILSQPSCPTGVVHTGAELAALAAVLSSASRGRAHPLTVVSDEAHRDTVWSGARFASPMGVYAETMSVYSFGKAWSLQGQRTGYVALGPGMTRAHQTRTGAERALRSLGYGAPTALMQRLVVELSGLTPQTGSLAAEQRKLRALLAEAGLRTVEGEATSFVYARCPEHLDDWDMVRRLAATGLLAMPSSLFHEGGHIRFALNTEPTRLPDVAARVAQALTTDTAGRTTAPHGSESR